MKTPGLLSKSHPFRLKPFKKRLKRRPCLIDEYMRVISKGATDRHRGNQLVQLAKAHDNANYVEWDRLHKRKGVHVGSVIQIICRRECLHVKIHNSSA